MFILNSPQYVFFHLEEILLKGTQFNSRQAGIKNKKNLACLFWRETNIFVCLFGNIQSISFTVIWEGYFINHLRTQILKHKIMPFNPTVISLKQCHKNIAQAVNNSYLKKMSYFAYSNHHILFLKLKQLNSLKS